MEANRYRGFVASSSAETYVKRAHCCALSSGLEAVPGRRPKASDVDSSTCHNTVCASSYVMSVVDLVVVLIVSEMISFSIL